MESVLEIVMDTLEGAGGSMLYPALLDAVPAQYHSYLPRVLRHLKDAKQVQARIHRDEETGAMLHTVSLV